MHMFCHNPIFIQQDKGKHYATENWVSRCMASYILVVTYSSVNPHQCSLGFVAGILGIFC